MASFLVEGLILKKRDFGEADRVLTVLTDRFGKISVIAKGVRRITSRRAGNIELLNIVKLHLFKAKNYTLTEAEGRQVFPKIKSNLTLSTTAFYILELVDKLLPEDEKNLQVYDLTKETLYLLENNPRQLFIRAFEIKILSILGFFSIGGVSQEVSDDLKNKIKIIEYGSWQEIAQMEISKEEVLELEQISAGFLHRVLEKSLKSAELIKKIRE
jgi:DNA repair protein RecO (recombination protein O)